MIDPDSRYAQVGTATWTDADGREIVHLRRRVLPRVRDLSFQGTVALRPAERLDLLAARIHGDPLAWWRIADANEAMHPDDLTADAGRRLAVAVPLP